MILLGLYHDCSLVTRNMKTPRIMSLRYRVTAIVLLLLVLFSSISCTTIPTSTDDGHDGHLDPLVNSFRGVVSKVTCNAIIAEAERLGFPLEADSIDSSEPNNKYSQAIDIVDYGKGVLVESLWELIEPLIPTLTEIVQSTKESLWNLERAQSKIPTVDWIFMRKYAPSSERNMLKVHHDINMFTVNLFLSDEYEGGGLFYVRPPAGLGYTESAPVPQIPDEWMTYHWLSTIQQKNTTITRFPNLNQGDVLIHNYTVWHAIAPLEAGLKYSLVFFFDMDNPDVQELLKKDVNATFINTVSDGTIDLVWINTNNAVEEEVVIQENMEVGMEYPLQTNEDSIWRFIRREDKEVVAEFVVQIDQNEPYVSDGTWTYSTPRYQAKFINHVKSGTIDLMWIPPDLGEEGIVMVDEAMLVGELSVFNTDEGHIFRAIRREDGVTIMEILVEADRVDPYEIFDPVDVNVNVADIVVDTTGDEL